LGNSTCTSYYKCKNCGQTVNKRMGDHTCGNVYCKTSKDYYPSEHQCYMLPADYNDRQKKQTYIFFDFECTRKLHTSVICNEYMFRCHPIGILVDTGSCHLGYIQNRKRCKFVSSVYRCNPQVTCNTGVQMDNNLYKSCNG
jgi:hypothetical protein